MAIQLIEVQTPQQIKTVAELADEIWHQHYQGILKPDQIDYMVEHFQSEAALTEQMRQGYRYLLAIDSESNTPCGFCGYHREEENGRMFVSKIYIRQSFRRRGIAGQFLQELWSVSAIRSNSFSRDMFRMLLGVMSLSPQGDRQE